MTGCPLMYEELSEWWPLLSPPGDYAEEAAFYSRTFLEHCEGPARTLLELGSGGGNNAFHMKHDFAHVTLVDVAPGMLAVSRALNPECEHVAGDMRSVRLARIFDCVFVHDAICYATTLEDLERTLATAYAHCRPGGVALFVPDYVRESFRATTAHGGHDLNGRGLRYLEWTWDPDPDDTTYVADYALVLREPDGTVQVRHDRHVEGLFATDVWLGALTGVGFDPRLVPFRHTELPQGGVVFVGARA